MTLLAVGVGGRGLVDPALPVFPADDEALLRGGVAFETLRVYGGRPFLLGRHLERLRHSARALELPALEGATELARLVAAVAPPEHVLRVYRSSAQLVVTAAALPAGLDEQRAGGITLSTIDVGAPSPLLVGVKSTSYALSFAARRTALAAGADDALLVGGGAVLDCSTANVWWRAGETLCTPPAGPGVLAGITRGLLLELEHTVERPVRREELAGADEVFTTSSVREVMPVVAIDGAVVGDGLPGPAAARLQAALRLRSAV
jgi:branched-subunit amino acid aminotransferase/4-amino-4-deoxychorismate lyase